MSVASRAYRGTSDFRRVHGLLVESYRLTGRILCWGIDRWEKDL